MATTWCLHSFICTTTTIWLELNYIYWHNTSAEVGINALEFHCCKCISFYSNNPALVHGNSFTEKTFNGCLRMILSAFLSLIKKRSVNGICGEGEEDQSLMLFVWNPTWTAYSTTMHRPVIVAEVSDHLHLCLSNNLHILFSIKWWSTSFPNIIYLSRNWHALAWHL